MRRRAAVIPLPRVFRWRGRRYAVRGCVKNAEAQRALWAALAHYKSAVAVARAFRITPGTVYRAIRLYQKRLIREGATVDGPLGDRHVDWSRAPLAALAGWKKSGLQHLTAMAFVRARRARAIGR